MSKVETLPTFTTTPTASQMNDAFPKIATAFDNTLSRDGSTPNAMGADFDMNGNDIMNVGTLNVSGAFILNGNTVQSDAAFVANGYLTRAEFVTWNSANTKAVGYVTSAAGRSYIYSGSATTISDLVGWIPLGTAWLDQWPITVAGFQAALTYCSGTELRIPSGTLSYTSSNQNFFSGVSNTTLVGSGIGISNLVFTGSSTFWYVFRGTNFTIKDTSVTLTNSGNVTGHLWSNSFGAGIYILRCGITGNVVASGGVYTKNTNIISISDGATPRDDIEVSDCIVSGMSFTILRSNSATSQVDSIKITRNDFVNCHKEVMGINAPLGTINYVEISGNTMKDHFMVADGESDGHYIAVAGADNVIIKNNFLVGVVREGIHIENAANSVIISNNILNLDFTGLSSQAMIAVLPGLGGAGVMPRRLVISDNIMLHTGASQLGYGVWPYDFTSGSQIQGGRNMTITGNIVENCLVGIDAMIGGDNSGIISDNNAINCKIGFLSRGTGGRQYKRNTSTGCVYGAAVQSQGVFVDHSFVNCTNILGSNTAAVGKATLDRFTVVGPDRDYGAAGSFSYTLLNGVSAAARLSGRLSSDLVTSGGAFITYAQRKSDIIYDGATYTESGVVTVSGNISASSTALASQIITASFTVTAAQLNTRYSVSFDGYAFVSPPIVV